MRGNDGIGVSVFPINYHNPKSRHSRKSGNPVRSVSFFFEFRATSESSFPRRWESRSVRTGTYAPSFPRKRESRPFGFSFLVSGNFCIVIPTQVGI
ncbi:pilus assembly protein PilS [Neisseria meningitidis]|uniref:Pilus assembly protein PilS n=1 Tax=Neisseria meningitidis TaxID=487 RepID=A0AB36RUE3_NEIME|nr:pilus assembly protein PilS [Neisseria meningitidis]ATL37614.1 pilus assembly protein PilS [Neisseria meningitidis]AUX07477.1 hypothetical protein BVD88_11790 [Neisseria meningitidis]MCI3200290.1 pilus assembly protein PilS [Neisseria meningitidis]PBJ88666.1 pilus assembly protein PilS [Neisseria meningitidis]